MQSGNPEMRLPDLFFRVLLSLGSFLPLWLLADIGEDTAVNIEDMSVHGIRGV